MGIKIFLAILATAASTFIGYSLGKKYSYREKYFCQAVLFCKELKCEIGFCRKKLSDIVASKLNSQGRVFCKTLSEYLNVLQKGIEPNQQTLQTALSKGNLTNEEFDLVVDFLTSLGKSDVFSQTNIIDGFCVQFEQKHNECLELRKKYNGIHIKLGAMCGLLIAILLI